MTRARDSEEVSGVKEEKTTNVVSTWDSPNLPEDLVDRIYDMVRGWERDREPAASDFFHYCRDLCESQSEADQAWVWMLNLIAHFVAKDESWLDSIHSAKDWRQLGLSGIEDYWEVPPPLWLVEREEEGKRKDEEEKKKESEKMEESLECSPTSPVLNPGESAEESLENTTASPLDRDWGKELPAPSTAIAAPSTPVWRPWEENIPVVNLSAAKQKRRRRSPAAAHRSRRRLQLWQEKMDKARLTPELRSTPYRSFKQIRSSNLLQKMDEHHVDTETMVKEEVESSVFFCNYTQTLMHPQSTKHSTNTMTPFQPTC